MNINCKEFGRLTGAKYDKMFEQSKRIYSTDGLSPTIHTMQGGNTELKVAILKENVSEGTSKPRVLGHYNYPNSNKAHQSSTFYDKIAVSPTLDTCEGGNRQVKILVDTDKLPLALDEQNKYIRTDGTVGTIMTDGSSPKHNNRVLEPKWISEKGVNYICDPKRGMCTDVNADIAQTLTATGQSNWTGSFVSPDIDHLEKSSTIGSSEPVKVHLKNGQSVTSNDDLSQYRIRKLTPKECWRLMGFDDADFDKAEKVCSNTQLYKQAGNSIVVNVLEGILGNLLLKPSRSEWLDELLGV